MPFSDMPIMAKPEGVGCLSIYTVAKNLDVTVATVLADIQTYRKHIAKETDVNLADITILFVGPHMEILVSVDTMREVAKMHGRGIENRRAARIKRLEKTLRVLRKEQKVAEKEGGPFSLFARSTESA